MAKPHKNDKILENIENVYFQYEFGKDKPQLFEYKAQLRETSSGDKYYLLYIKGKRTIDGLEEKKFFDENPHLRKGIPIHYTYDENAEVISLPAELR